MEVKLLTTVDITKEGTCTVTVEAKDVNGNVTTGKATLKVTLDSKAPVFSGVGNVTLAKYSTFDFYAGVKAVDARDGQVTFTVDYSKVDTTKAGSYYAVYTAQNALGNTPLSMFLIALCTSSLDADTPRCIYLWLLIRLVFKNNVQR